MIKNIRRLLAFLTPIAVSMGLTMTAAQPCFAEPKWITAQGVSPTAPVVLHFRRELRLARLPRKLIVQVSADNRFILYVNGKRAAEGPSRGDLLHWRYESVDLAPFLKTGNNVIAVAVWNTGPDAMPLAQISARTGFWIKGRGLDSGPSWRVEIVRGHTFVWPYPMLEAQFGSTYYAAGSSEIIDGSKTDWLWTLRHTSEKDWTTAVLAVKDRASVPWTLERDNLPPMRYVEMDAGKVVRTDYDAANDFPNHSIVIPSNSEKTILIDASTILSAYPNLTVSGGKGASIVLKYAEALADENGHKGDRNAVGSRQVRGITDTFLPDGGQMRTFQPLWWRTWRYLELKVHTGSEPLRLDALSLFQTGYPLKQVAHFESDDSALNQIWQVGWHTLEVDAHETYTDSAYWEQLQYEGDTRLTMLMTYALTGDRRLPIEALDAFGNSQRQDGMLQGAYPSHGENIIPPYALVWVNMIHDYWMQEPDVAPVVRNLPKARKVLAWYSNYVAPNGLLLKVPGWSFIDWVNLPWEQHERFPSYDPISGTSCLTSLNYLAALQDQAEMELALGDKQFGVKYGEAAASLKKALRDLCWDDKRGIFADDPSKTTFSQQTNALAVLYDVAPREKMADILHKVTLPSGIDAPPGMWETSYYFSWYLIHAYDHAGLGDHYIEMLQTWKDLLKLHYTAWPETRGETRSDEHAWSAHPTADLLGIVAGIRSAAPGYRAVLITPHLKGLNTLSAQAATPRGVVYIDYHHQSDLDVFDITLPVGLPGNFRWKDKTWPLKAGENHISVE